MLLSSLSILMGAILVPIEYLWVYSTHIILVCLYLIYTKRLIVACLTLLSFISIGFHEFSHTSLFPLLEGREVWVDFKHQKIIALDAQALDRNEKKKQYDVHLVFSSKDGTRQNLGNFSLVFAHNQINPATYSTASSFVKGEVKSVLLADKNGPWWQRNLYIKRQAAQLEMTFFNKEPDPFAVMEVTPRQWLSEQLDQSMEGFSSWRFSKALLLGQNDLWSERDTWVIRTLGLAHLFVVSGLHTGFMFVIGRLISRCLWQFFPDHLLLSGVTRWHCDVLIILPLLFGYAYLTHWGEPVVRASIMLSAYLCARMLVLKISAYDIITFALWLVLLVEPRSILSPGLWLSFSMVYLLIGFCQLSTQLSRLLILQVMLSTASMVLILGWQEGISSVSILANVLLIPFAGFIWFPWGIVSCLEALVLGSTYGYYLLEQVLNYVELLIEWAAFLTPIFYFETFSSSGPRTIMLLLIGYWVFQSPLKRGVVSALMIWFVLFSPIVLEVNKADFRLENKENILVFSDENTLLLSDAWAGEDLEKLMIDDYLPISSDRNVMLSPNAVSTLSPQTLLKHDIDWVIFKRKVPSNLIETLKALNVNWLLLSVGDSLDFRFQNNRVEIRHSACIYSFFLFKSDTCKRVEKLESVLNY